jgi:hypothetical protein
MEAAMVNYVIAGVLVVFIVVVLVTLKRVERRRERKPGD